MRAAKRELAKAVFKSITEYNMTVEMSYEEMGILRKEIHTNETFKKF